jgi:thiol-disulfide isomerase/thioredoxin
MKTLRLLTAAVAAILLFSPVRADPVTPTLAPGWQAMVAMPAPGWELKDVDGKPVNFSQFKGKVVVLDFWATWCGPCRSEIPGYVMLQEKYQDKGLVIIGVSLDQDGPEVVKKFIGDFRVNYPIVLADEKIVHAYGDVEYLPTTFIIDRTGKIREEKIGPMETAEFEKVLRQYLN